VSRKRRGSRLFSGQPGLLLVSEDIPGIVMPAPPPVEDLPPLEEDEGAFDIDALHAAEDAADASGHEGPLRVFLGAPGTEEPEENQAFSDQEAQPAVADDGPIWDVSALAMPEAPSEDASGDEGALDFLDEDHDVSEDEVIELDGAPPPLVMQVSLDESPDLSAADWSDDTPTVPALANPLPAVIRDAPPPVHVTSDGDPLEVPDRTPFEVEPAGDDFSEDGPTRVEAMVSDALDDGALSSGDWDEDEVTFFGDGERGEFSEEERSIPDEPPSLKAQPPGKSPNFRPIPDKVDPPVVPILMALIGIVVIAVILVMKYGGEESTVQGTLDNPVKSRPPLSAPRTPSVTRSAEAPVGDMGYVSITSDKPAIIYVGGVERGDTPMMRMEVSPGSHRIMASDVETGARKVVNIVVSRGEERPIRFQFK